MKAERALLSPTGEGFTAQEAPLSASIVQKTVLAGRVDA